MRPWYFPQKSGAKSAGKQGLFKDAIGKKTGFFLGKIRKMGGLHGGNTTFLSKTASLGGSQERRMSIDIYNEGEKLGKKGMAI